MMSWSEMKDVMDNMAKENYHDITIKEALGYMEHGVQVGSIVFQMPEDEHIIAAIMVALKKQVPHNLEDVSAVYTGEKTGTCKCGYESVMEHQKHCIECGQMVSWG